MEGTIEGFLCKYCNAYIPTFNTAISHKCFRNKEIYVDCNNILFAYNKEDVDDQMEFASTDNSEQSIKHNKACDIFQETECASTSSSEQSIKHNKGAVWTDNATMALLSLYEANMHILDHPKKKGRIWTAITDGLKDFKIEMSTDQVRWKMNALQKKYKECCDNNDKSGRSKMEFKWYNQLDEIFGRNKDAIAAHTISSQIKRKNSESALSIQKDVANNAPKTSSTDTVISVPTSPIASGSTDLDASPSIINKKIQIKTRRGHGTGSNLANKKLNIEEQWLKFLQDKVIRDAARDDRHVKSEERATESFMLKKQIISLKKKQMEQKKELLNKKLKDKENRHAEIIQIEKKKCKLLTTLFSKGNMKDMSDDSD